MNGDNKHKMIDEVSIYYFSIYFYFSTYLSFVHFILIYMHFTYNRYFTSTEGMRIVFISILKNLSASLYIVIREKKEYGIGLLGKESDMLGIIGLEENGDRCRSVGKGIENVGL